MESDNPFNEKKAANGTNTPPGNNSDDSGGSKETSLTSTSWEEEYSLSDMKENFPRAFSPLHRSLVQNSYDADRSSNTEHALANLECQLARLTLQFHSLAQSYNDSVARLRQAEHENELLRKQNLELQASNMEFVKLIARKDSYVGHTSSSINNDLSPAASVYSFPDTTSSLLSLESLYTDFPQQKSNAFISQLANDSDKSLTGFRPRPEKFAAGSSGLDAKGAAAVACRTKVNNNRQSVLPKSISIRSNGYLSLKTNQLSKKPPPLMPKPLPVIPPQRPHRLRLTAATDPLAGAHACTEAENLDVEYDVYNQGMFKTELCNKWQDTGSCPYGERCQFAHGLEELRPVIRHPRYKTELCRMVAAGEKCPYGHRCHFRHCLSREEKLAISSSSNDAAPVRSLP